MNVKKLSLYLFSINLVTSFFAVATADEVNESLIGNSTDTNAFDLENSAQMLISDIVEQEDADTQEAIVTGNRVIEYSTSPFEANFLEPATIESATTLPSGVLDLSSGFIVYPTNSESTGVGLQVYYGSIEYGVTDRLQIGADVSFFDDVLGDRFNGERTNLTFSSVAPNVKYKLIEEPSYSLGIVGSLEWIQVRSENGLFSEQGTSARQKDNVLAGTIQLPVIYNISENAQWHAVAGATIFPETVNGGDFYGTFFNVGTGITLQLSERFGLLADINFPIGSSGGNSVNTDGSISEKVVWNAGFSYLHSPNLALDFSVTNRLGTTPATKLLTFLPNGDEVGALFKLRYTPDLAQTYRGNFGDNPFPPMTYREKQLLFDGILLSSPTTVRKGMILLDGGITTDGDSGGAQLSFGLSDTAQIEFLASQLADNDQPLQNNFKSGVATKLNFLNQAQGDSFSLGSRIALVFQDGTDSFLGDLSFAYSPNDTISFTLNPKVALFSDESIVGAGLGVNLQLSPGLQLIGEVTPMLSDDPFVWAAAARYLFPKSNFGLGVYGTNTSGKGNIGSLIRQSDDDVSVGFNLMWLLGGGRSD
ncbi:hypothetical protein [Picosynechococcus sp. NKBG042902]|uniref:hypothetical protein n=1 Tax=Picosynechococcus sp. NKBG042902 TaxID=490193 RepID=UPI0004AB95A1|nr:hypothetical protein [Picosynechococcus sp. NKBG042902]